MANLIERLRAWFGRRGTETKEQKDDWTQVGETHRPSGALGHGSNVPQGYVPPTDEGRPPH
jgi:hypothetical protein